MKGFFIKGKTKNILSYCKVQKFLFFPDSDSGCCLKEGKLCKNYPFGQIRLLFYGVSICTFSLIRNAAFRF